MSFFTIWMRKLQEIKNLKERTALVRVDFNVPVGSDGVVDDSEASRIEKSLETIKHLQQAGTKTVLVSHIGRDKKESLRPVADYLSKFVPVKFIPTLDPADVAGIISNMAPGETVLLENLRQNPGEEGNDLEFASWLASLADFYVNEAFAVSHRSHASIVSVPMYLQSYAGFWFQKEIDNLSKVMKDPARPFLFILGGAKFDTKLPLIKKFEHIADEILIGGALANNFFKEIGFNIGKSLIDKEANVFEFFNKENIKIPFDVVTKNGAKEIAMLDKEDIIVDMGPETLAEWKKSVAKAKTILWNGPLGLYEEGFDIASKELLSAVAESGAFSVIGGGDTIKLVKDMKLDEKVSFISTGGGAMLEYLSHGTLPGIMALEAGDGLSTNTER